jgi:hypothetical protein
MVVTSLEFFVFKLVSRIRLPTKYSEEDLTIGGVRFCQLLTTSRSISGRAHGAGPCPGRD